MLLGGVTRYHPNNDVVTLCKGDILEGEVMAGLDERPGDDLPGVTAEHKTKETLSRLVEVPGKHQPLIQRGAGRTKSYRMSIHTALLYRTTRIWGGL
jgi:hypothetical protein